MKLQIDFDNKIIKLESDINLGEFIEKIEKMFPDWKEYKLQNNVKIEWHSYPVYPTYPRWYNGILYTAGSAATLTTSNNSLAIGNTSGNTINAANYKTGTYNIEC